jgi:NADH-quinone oxidoreductase subunit J
MSIAEILFTTVVVALAGSGTYLLLPHGHGTVKSRNVHIAGAALASLGLLGFLMFWISPGPFPSGLFFYLFSIGALVGALLTVTSRNPVYSALWFASVVLSTAGLFLLAGAEFLAAGTVIVYAGAIIVTFLFVIMLAQSEGKATYDRAARAPGASTFTCFLLFWCLLYTLSGLRRESSPPGDAARAQAASERNLVRAQNLGTFHLIPSVHPVGPVLQHSLRETSSLRDSSGAEKPNVAGLGEALYTEHLLTIELAGALLFIALIAAVVFTNPKRPVRPGEPGELAAAKT